MTNTCDLIKDLLPLYHDDVCSLQSRQIVEEHLKGCDTCKELLAKIGNETYDARLSAEREDVVGRHTKAVRRKSLIIGTSIGGVLAVPVIVCLIVNLAVDRALDWFFIVLASLMVVASITVVPLVMEEEKGLWTLGSFTGSLVALLLTCALYTGGNWFFVAVVPILFGLAVIFGPYVISKLPLTGFPSRHKGLLAMAADTALLYAIIIISGLYSGAAFDDYWRYAFTIPLVWLALPWGLFMIIRYVKENSLIRGGLSVLAATICLIFSGELTNLILSGRFIFPLTGADLTYWGHHTVINANVYLLTLLTGVITGGALLAFGMVTRKR